GGRRPRRRGPDPRRHRRAPVHQPVSRESARDRGRAGRRRTRPRARRRPDRPGPDCPVRGSPRTLRGRRPMTLAWLSLALLVAALVVALLGWRTRGSRLVAALVLLAIGIA